MEQFGVVFFSFDTTCWPKIKGKKAPIFVDNSLIISATIGSVILLGFEPRTHSLEG